MKTYVLIISEKFPMSHNRAGEPTYFIRSIKDGLKVHTIRNNYYLWKYRVNEVQSGRAVISLRKWEWRPYFSKQVEIMQLTRDDKVGVESLIISDDLNNAEVGELGDTVSSNLISFNDGLPIEDFKEWFKGYAGDHLLAIIHFTSLRYSNVSI